MCRVRPPCLFPCAAACAATRERKDFVVSREGRGEWMRVGEGRGRRRGGGEKWGGREGLCAYHIHHVVAAGRKEGSLIHPVHNCMLFAFPYTLLALHRLPTRFEHLNRCTHVLEDKVTSTCRFQHFFVVVTGFHVYLVCFETGLHTLYSMFLRRLTP